jgi:hypothetical protein
MAVFGTTKQAAEKVKSFEENCGVHPSAGKAGVNLIDLLARVTSCPSKTALGTSFSQPVKCAFREPADLHKVVRTPEQE